jgi:hypothetical protein
MLGGPILTINKNLRWKKYRVGLPSTADSFGNDSCREFSTVHHVAHIGDAIRIFEDGFIRSSLVWDESVLRNTRTCVAWVSPNTWGNGSIYGNVSFEFRWDELVDGLNLYWVEDMPPYNPPAFRILASQKAEGLSDLVTPYDPTVGDGPLFLSDGLWYWNGNYTGEFMIDADLPLKCCEAVDFASHHPNICAKSLACPDKGLGSNAAGSVVVAAAIGQDIEAAAGLFRESDDSEALIFAARAALSDLIVRYENQLPEEEKSRIGASEAGAVVKASLAAYGRRQKEDAYTLIKMIGKRRVFRRTFIQVAACYFGITHEQLWKSLEC